PCSPLFPYTTLFRSRPPELVGQALRRPGGLRPYAAPRGLPPRRDRPPALRRGPRGRRRGRLAPHRGPRPALGRGRVHRPRPPPRSEEHTSELQSLAY